MTTATTLARIRKVRAQAAVLEQEIKEELAGLLVSLRRDHGFKSWSHFVAILRQFEDRPNAWLRARALGTVKPNDDVTLKAARALAARPEGAPSGGLTAHQRAILASYTQGISPKAIAASLGLSPKTVQNHLSLIKRRIELKQPPELAHSAIDHGPIAPPSDETR